MQIHASQLHAPQGSKRLSACLSNNKPGIATILIALLPLQNSHQLSPASRDNVAVKQKKARTGPGTAETRWAAELRFLYQALGCLTKFPDSCPRLFNSHSTYRALGCLNSSHILPLDLLFLIPLLKFAMSYPITCAPESYNQMRTCSTW